MFPVTNDFTSCYLLKANAANFKTNIRSMKIWFYITNKKGRVMIHTKESKMTDTKGLLVCLRTNSITHTHIHTSPHIKWSINSWLLSCPDPLCSLFKSSARTGPVLWVFSPRRPGPLCGRPWWASAWPCGTPPLLAWLRGMSWAWALWFAELTKAEDKKKK